MLGHALRLLGELYSGVLLQAYTAGAGTARAQPLPGREGGRDGRVCGEMGPDPQPERSRRRRDRTACAAAAPVAAAAAAGGPLCALPTRRPRWPTLPDCGARAAAAARCARGDALRPSARLTG